MALSQRFSYILLSFLFFLLSFLAVLPSASGQEIGYHDAPCTGNTMEFYVMASSQLKDLTWSVSGAGWKNASDNTNGQTITGTFSEENTAQIDVRFTDADGDSHHKSLAVAIKSPKSPSVSISSTPSDLSSVCQGNITRFSATPVNGGDGPAYSWYLNDVLQTRPNSSTFQPTSLPPGTYEVYVGLTSNIPCATDGNSYATSNTISFTIEEKTTMEPVVSLYHPSGTVYDGCSATFQVLVEGESEGLTYKWFKGNSVVTSDVSEDVSGGNNLDNKLVINEYNGEEIRCEVSKDAFCYEQNVSSSPLAIPTTASPAFSVGIEGVDRGLCKDEEITFTADSDMSGATYTWDDKKGDPSQGRSFTTTAISEEYLKGISVTASVLDPCGDGEQYLSANNNLEGVEFIIYDPEEPTVVQPHISEYNTSATLTASGALTGESYRWYTDPSEGSPLNSTTTPILTANTTYYVSKYVDAEGCESSRIPFEIIANRYPLADAGDDQTIVLPMSPVTLNGSGSDPDLNSTISYLWEKTGGPAVTIDNDEMASTTLSDLQPGTYVFGLTVSDEYEYDAFDEVTLIVQRPPSMNLGADRVIILPTNSLTLRGRTSDDGNILSHTWTKEKGPTANIADPDKEDTDITDLVAGRYVFKLFIEDDDKLTASDEINVHVQSRPTVNAGEDQIIFKPTSYTTLKGVASDEDGPIKYYKWSQPLDPKDPEAVISTDNKAETDITGLDLGTYEFKLTVTDEDGLTASDEVTVTVTYPPNNYNYIRTTSTQVKGITETDQLKDLSAYEKSVSTTYFDGLGRPMQEVAWQASPKNLDSPNMEDIVQPIQYDDFGREVRKYLPYVANKDEGYYDPDAVKEIKDYESSHQYEFYQTAEKVAQDAFPFAETIFEASPLNRVEKQGAPGADWQPGSGHTVKMNYKANLVTDRIINWVYAYAEEGFGDLLADGYYQNGQLYVTETVNEDNQKVKEYTDKQGRVVLKDVRDESDEPHFTYYVYDDFSNLRAVLQPEFLEAWIKEGGILQDPVDYEGYQVIEGDVTVNDCSEGTNYYVQKSGSLTFGEGTCFKGEVIMEQELEPVMAAVLTDYVFYYHYDSRQRMVQKHVPGGGSTYMLYDQWDRLVLSQDEEQKNEEQTDENLWVFTKYDELNRPVMTGLWEDERSKEELRDLLNSFAGQGENRSLDGWHGYTTDQTFPVDVEENQVLTVTYYDDYGFKFLAEDADEKYAYHEPEVVVEGADFEEEEFDRVKGQVTGTKTKVLGGNEWLNTVSYYDDRYRLIQVLTQNNLGGIDRLSNAYDFAGKLMHSVEEHKGHQQFSILKSFNYDHMGRFLDSRQTIAEGDNTFQKEDQVLLAQHEYNALGELVDKKLHSQDGETFLQSVNYRYNIRGWLTSINNSSLSKGETNDDTDDFFGMELAYTHDLDLGTSEENFNGNITAIRWSANYGLNAEEKERAYTYGYDGLNRIKSADYHKKGMADWTTDPAYALTIDLYDKNGNIEELNRNGADGSPIDRLKYNYDGSGNRLRKVTDDTEIAQGFKDGNTVGDDYGYYKNGNLKLDKNKGISLIKYNYLNLPEEIIFDSGEEIKYTYDAAGVKLSRLVIKNDEESKLTEYLGGVVYEGEQLKFIQHEEGRVVYNSDEENPFEYQYNLQDHLGNVRLSFTSQEKTDTFLATMETSREPREKAEFLHYEESTRINAELFDHTNEGGTYYSHRLSGVAKERIGLAKSLAVMPGDVVSAEVYAKYADPDIENWDSNLAALMTSIASGSSSVIVDGIGINLEENSMAGLLGKDDPEGIQAYLNIVIVDENFQFVDAGYQAVGVEAKEDGSGVAHQHLSTKEYAIEKPGYVYIFLSNENETLVDVFFDDFTVTHQHSLVVQADDYYPFGLTFNSYVSGDKNKYLYQGKELQKDLGLETYDFEARMYDPAIGRTFQLDPHADSYFDLSPYSWVANNPINIIDPTGMDTVSVNNLDMENLDTEEDVVMLDEVSVSPSPITEEVDGEEYHFGRGDSELAKLGLKLSWAPDNSIENYRYYLKNKDKFGDAEFNEIFVSNKQRRLDAIEDAMMEFAEMLTRGDFDSGRATSRLTKNRRSKYANLFPSNKKEFTPSSQQTMEYRLYQAEKSLSPAQRSPEFRHWENKYKDSKLIFK